MASNLPTLAVLGGTGDLGGGLAFRWAKAGYPIIIGSRRSESADKAAVELTEKSGSTTIKGLDNREAAAKADIVVLTVPFAHQRPILETVRDEVQGKIFVDTTVPLVPPKVRTVQLPPEGSAAQAAQDFLGDEVRVVSAFQNVAAAHLQDEHHQLDCDILVCGNVPDAREAVITLVTAAGMKGWHSGQIANSAAAEALTSVLIFLNNRYKIDGAGFRITGE